MPLPKTYNKPYYAVIVLCDIVLRENDTTCLHL